MFNRVRKFVNLFTKILVVFVFVICSAYGVTKEDIEEIDNKIEGIDERQELASTMADCARKLDLPEDSETIQTAKKVVSDGIEDKQELVQEKEELRRQLEEDSTRVDAGTFRLTGYCPCVACSGTWGTDTYSGISAVEGVTVAADPNIFPIGTRVYIEGLGERIVQDVGGAIKGKRIDVYVDEHWECFQTAVNRDNVRVWVIKSGPMEETSEVGGLSGVGEM